MFRESVGNYKLNQYMNREDFRSLKRAIVAKRPSDLQKLQVLWLEEVSKEINHGV